MRWKGDGRTPDDIISLPPASKDICSQLCKQWATLPAGGSAGCEAVLTEDPNKLIWRVWLGLGDGGGGGGGVDVLVSAVATCITGMSCCMA